MLAERMKDIQDKLGPAAAASARELALKSGPAGGLPGAAGGLSELAVDSDGAPLTDALPGAAERKHVRRFYDNTGVHPVDMYGRVVDAASPDAAFWEVLLDGKPVKTIGMANLHAPTRRLALAIAAEFAAQSEIIHPSATPLYTMLSSAIDQYPEETERLQTRIGEFLETDAVCYRVGDATGDPRDMVCHERQEKYYRPLIDWFEQHFGGPLGVVSGIGVPVHPPEVMPRVVQQVTDADMYLKAAISTVLDTTKSCVITLAFIHRHIGVAQAFDAARVEEEHQIEEGGFVFDGHDTARVHVRLQLAAASTFLHLLGKGSQPAKLRPLLDGGDGTGKPRRKKRASKGKAKAKATA